MRLARRLFAFAGGWGMGAVGADWAAPAWKCLGREALRPALRPIDLVSGARVGCVNLKNVTRERGMLTRKEIQGDEAVGCGGCGRKF